MLCEQPVLGSILVFVLLMIFFVVGMWAAHALNRPYRVNLRRLAIRAHIRMAAGGRSVPNGWSCMLCDAECNEGEKLEHRLGCCLR